MYRESKPPETTFNVNYDIKKGVPIAALEMVDDCLAIAECGIPSIVTNSYINTKVEMKNLRFGIDMKSGKASKCHQIHIGKYEDKCPTLKAHEINVEKVEEDLYVGDIISNDGKFTKNIKTRYAKATGVTSQIMLMLKEISLEFHYFSIAMVYRNLLFINSVLVNAEVWYPISEKDIKDLIDADKILLRKIFEVPVSTPICLLFLESGEIPIEKGLLLVWIENPQRWTLSFPCIKTLGLIT